MKVLHIVKTDLDEMTRALITAFEKSPEHTSTVIRLDNSTDYEALMDMIFEHDKVISWW